MLKVIRNLLLKIVDGIEQRVIESAIVFWFKDADCKSENKVVEYFREH